VACSTTLYCVGYLQELSSSEIDGSPSLKYQVNYKMYKRVVQSSNEGVLMFLTIALVTNNKTDKSSNEAFALCCNIDMSLHLL